MRFLEILIAGRYGVTKELCDLWNRTVSLSSFRKSLVCEPGTKLMPYEAEQLALNNSAINKHLPNHLKDTHVLELLEVREDTEGDAIFIVEDEDHPAGPGCPFRTEEGEPILSLVAQDGVGHQFFGLTPRGTVLNPLKEYMAEDLVEIYAISRGVCGANLVTIGFDKLSESAMKSLSKLKEGEVPFKKLVWDALGHAFGTQVRDSLDKAIGAYEQGKEVGWAKYPYHEANAMEEVNKKIKIVKGAN